MTSVNYICERCGQPADVVHHRVYISPSNRNDPGILYDWNNLEALCLRCHNKEHFEGGNKTVFDAAGNILSVSESQSVQQMKQDRSELSKLLSRISQGQEAEQTNE